MDLIVQYHSGDVDVLLEDCGLSISDGMQAHASTLVFLVDPSYAFACKLCDKRLPDLDVAALHASTDKHKRQWKFSRDGSDEVQSCSLKVGDFDFMTQNVIEKLGVAPQIGRCLLCKTIFSDPTQVLGHISSKRHRQNLDWYQRVHVSKALGKFISTRDTHPSRKRIPFEDELYDDILPPPNFVISDSVVRSIRTLPAGIAVREWDYYCTYCEAKLMDHDQMLQHLSSHSHIVVRDAKGTEVARRGTVDVPTVQDTNWESAVRNGLIPPPPLNRRPMNQTDR